MSTELRAEVEEAVKEAIADLTVGEATAATIQLTDKAIGDLGLDSPAEVEFICLVEVRLGVEIDGKVRPLVEENEHRGRTVEETIRFLCDYVARERSAEHVQ